MHIVLVFDQTRIKLLAIVWVNQQIAIPTLVMPAHHLVRDDMVACLNHLVVIRVVGEDDSGGYTLLSVLAFSDHLRPHTFNLLRNLSEALLLAAGAPLPLLIIDVEQILHAAHWGRVLLPI